ncbi:MAG: helix-turn-helix domain-containing protein, partial [Nitrospirota bacterium]
IKGISPEAMAILSSYHWPGNVRELENVIRRAVVVANSDIIDVPDINLNSDSYKKELQELSAVVNNLLDTAVAEKTTDGIFRCVVTKTERTLIEKALSITKGNQVQASELLGITRVTLRKKIQEYNIPSV